MKNDGSKPIGDPSSITRRQILQRFGMLGTTSLMMGALDAWDLMGAQPGPRPALRGMHPETSVIVLGAGLSGLVAGYELGKLGYDYRILEARDRVGGLIWSVRRGDSHTEIGGGESQVCQFDQGEYINAGAWRLPKDDTSVFDYCAELGVPVEMFVNSTDNNFFYEEAGQGALSGRRVRLAAVKADLWGSTNELLTKALDQGQIDVPLSEEDQELLVQFLVRSGYLGGADHLYRPPADRGSSEQRYDLSALLQSGFAGRVRSLDQGPGGPAPMFQPVGGMQQIPIAFHRVQRDKVSLGSEVRSITQTEDAVRVVYRDTRTGQESEATADYCVCCLPMSVLKTIDVNLSAETAAVVGGIGHSGSAKMGLQMKRRFWEEDDGIFGGHLFGNSLQMGEFSYPSNDYFTQKGVLLGFYGGGGTAGLADKNVQGRIEHVLTQASKVHPQMREEFEHAYCVWWDKVQFSLGAYARRPNAEGMAQLSEADGRIYFGSAAVSASPAWLRGAISSAWQTVETLHERVAQE